MARPWLIITRPEPDSRRFAEDLGEVAAELLIAPTQAIHRRPFGLPAETPDGLILTSENAAYAAASLPKGLPAWVVGQRTAAAVRAVGANVVFTAPTAEKLVTAMAEHPRDMRFLHLRGAHTTGNIAKRLGAEERIVYVQEPRPLSPAAREALGGERAVVLPLFSPRSAVLMAAEAGLTAPLHIVAMSEAVAEAAGPLRPARVEIAANPTARDMCAAVRRAIARV
ncbi:uroporphyrinogen-III synthase [Pseudoroseicyclus sp. CXY001]|uniref:uroporphyrinogen-III synthase n=1 Tax=Pseudoroseicyclus sp. CXY001 TaxID=3242492 RepID=UPI003570FB96